MSARGREWARPATCRVAAPQARQGAPCGLHAPCQALPPCCSNTACMCAAQRQEASQPSLTACRNWDIWRGVTSANERPSTANTSSAKPSALSKGLPSPSQLQNVAWEARWQSKEAGGRAHAAASATERCSQGGLNRQRSSIQESSGFQELHLPERRAQQRGPEVGKQQAARARGAEAQREAVPPRAALPNRQHRRLGARPQALLPPALPGRLLKQLLHRVLRACGLQAVGAGAGMASAYNSLQAPVTEPKRVPAGLDTSLQLLHQNRSSSWAYRVRNGAVEGERHPQLHRLHPQRSGGQPRAHGCDQQQGMEGRRQPAQHQGGIPQKVDVICGTTRTGGGRSRHGCHSAHGIEVQPNQGWAEAPRDLPQES